MKRWHVVMGLTGLVMWGAVCLRAQDTSPASRLAPQPTALATWDSLIGVTVRFPRRVSPDSITREQRVDDLFGGYEWRIILMSDNQVLLNAFVIPPSPTLMLRHYDTIAEAYYAGELRRCEKFDVVITCARLAAAAMRDVDGQMEITISDLRWLSLISRSKHPAVRLVVKRGGVDLLYQDIPLQYAQWNGFQDAIKPPPGKGAGGRN